MYLLFLEVLELLLLLFWYFLFILRLLEFPAISWLVLPAPSAFWCVALFIVLIALVLLSTLSTKHFRYTVSVTFPRQKISKFCKHYFDSGWPQTWFLKKTEKFVFLKIFVFLSKKNLSSYTVFSQFGASWIFSESSLRWTMWKLF